MLQSHHLISNKSATPHFLFTNPTES